MYGIALVAGKPDGVQQLLGAELEGVFASRHDGDAVLLQLQEQGIVEPAHRVLDERVGQLLVDEPEPLREQGGQAGDQLGLALDHPLEVGLVHRHEAAVLVGDGRGGARLVLQQRHLAEDVARLQHGQEHLVVFHDLGDLHHAASG